MNDTDLEYTQETFAGMINGFRGVESQSNGVFSLSEEREDKENTSAEADQHFATVDIPEETDEVIELGQDFNYDGYQVVRREFFAHINEPSISFNNYKVNVNVACLNRFPKVDYVQVLVNSERKILAIRPCKEEERDAFSWCTPGSAKRKPKQITCRLFFAKVFSLMDWNPDYRYKLLGKVIHANDEFLIAFDLSSTEVYQRINKEGGKAKTSRIPVFPEGWQNQFGLPFNEHKNSMQINIFDGYAVYGISDNKAPSTGKELSKIAGLSDELIQNEEHGGPNE